MAQSAASQNVNDDKIDVSKLQFKFDAANGKITAAYKDETAAYMDFILNGVS